MSVIPESCIVLPSLDLDEKEALEIAIANLSKLEQQFTKICSNLDHRLTSLKGKLGFANQRIGGSRQKVEALKDVTEAITLVSTSKFPKEYRKDHNLDLHHAVNEDFVNNRKIPWLDCNNNTNFNANKNASSHQTVNNRNQNYDDELKKIVKLTRGNFNSKRGLFSGNLPVQNQRFRGLGDVPRDIKSIDSLVLFNSRVNPYQNHTSIDNTESNVQITQPRKKQRRATDETQLKDEAPQTLIKGETLSAFELPDSRFRPSVKPAAELIGPSQLKLKGIVKYGQDEGEMESFIPSRGGIVKKPTLPDPEILKDPVADKESNLLDPSALSVERFSNTTSSVRKSANIIPQPVLNAVENNKPQRSHVDSFSPAISQVAPVSQQQDHATSIRYAPSEQEASSSNQRPEVQVNENDAVEMPTPIREPINVIESSLERSSSIRNPVVEEAKASSRPKPSSSISDMLKEIQNRNWKLKPASAVETTQVISAQVDLLRQIQKGFELKKPKPVEKPVPKPDKETDPMAYFKLMMDKRRAALNKDKEKRSRREEEEDSDEDT